MKKVFALLLALTLVLSLGVTAFAAGENSITVNNAQNGETYAAYKMFDLEVDLTKGQTGAYSYTVAEAWKDFFTTGAGAQYITVNDEGYVTEVSDAAALAKAAAAALSGKTADSSAVAANGTAVIEDLENGYYLITSTNGTVAMIDSTPTKPAQQIDEKNPNPSVDKNVQEDSTNDFGKKNDAQIGDTVVFKTEIKAYKGAKNYVLHDVMDDGLTLNADSITVTGLTKGTDYTVIIPGSEAENKCTFEVKFAQAYLDTITEETTLTVNYTAVLNANATYGVAEINKTQLTWGDQSKTEWVPTETYTYKFEVLKYDGTNDATAKNPLAGAVFQLKRDGVVVNLIKVSDTVYRVANGNETGAVDSFVTVGTEKITIIGVDCDTNPDNDKYTLVETKAPTGYNLLKDPVNVVVDAENKLVVDVPNKAGVELPSTGGIGTTIFYVLGSIMLVGAAVLLITKKRMSA